MKKYRKKPVVIEAIKYDSKKWNAEIRAYKGSETYPMVRLSMLPEHNPLGHGPNFVFNEVIETLEGDMKVSDGDFIITGLKGENYPCKPDIFADSYVDIAEEQKQEISDYHLLVDIYKKSGGKFELAIRRYIVQKDLTSSVLNRFLNYLDEAE